MPTAKGATLLETCMVAAVIGVLSVISVPSFVRAQQRFVLSSTAYEVRSELHRARILAITRNQDCRLRVTSPNTYLLECQTPAWVSVRLISLPASVSISANNRPEFPPDGKRRSDGEHHSLERIRRSQENHRQSGRPHPDGVNAESSGSRKGGKTDRPVLFDAC